MAAAVAANVLAGTGATALSESVSSPDGSLVANVSAGETLAYSITKNGRTVVAESALSFKFDGDVKLSWDGVKAVRESGCEKWRPVVKNRHEEVDIPWNELTIEGANASVTFRASDDGVAFRFRLPPGKVMSEDTLFNVPCDAKA